MSCCKHAWMRFLPHNWVCLKGLYVLFIVLFYVALFFTVYQDIQVARYPLLTGAQMWTAIAFGTLSNLAVAVGFLTLAKILKALAKIKHAVAPCGCENHTEEAAQ